MKEKPLEKFNRSVKKECAASAVLLIFSLFYLYFSTQIKKTPVAVVSSRFVPQLFGCLLLLLSIILFIQSFKKCASGDIDESSNPEQKSNYLKVFLTLLFITLYAAAIPIFGFFVATVAYLAAQIFLLAKKEERRPAVIIVTAVLSAVIIRFVFVNIFLVMLPSGILW
ncbi:tripartite tricarboxylate transporter TctB family protein [Lachnospiraceae bacterium NSJ-143]|nr:tripartite tricarboxylate transporter TctB family protein [Lachnospiraceae bacterium NSJ-143]